MSFSLPDK